MSIVRRPFLAYLAFLFTLQASIALAVTDVYVGTWGGPGEGRVYRYDGGTDWTDVSPTGGLGKAIWDLEIFEGLVHAAGFGTSNGQVWRLDGTWTDISPPSGYARVVSSLNELQGSLFATVMGDGLMRYEGGRTWTRLGPMYSAQRAVGSECATDHPQLHVGSGGEDDFWRYDAESYYPCDLNGCPPADGPICSGGCFNGSCIFSFAEHDFQVFAGAYAGAMYQFVPSSGDWTRASSPTRSHVQALASYHDRLHVGDAAGNLAVTSPSEHVEGFGDPFPVSALLADAADDLLWIGHGGVPFGFARRDGTSMVRTWDGATFVDRSLPDQFFRGVLAILAVDPDASTCGDEVEVSVQCDAGPEVTVECDGKGVAVLLDGTMTTATPAQPIGFRWEGSFVEGTATGMTATVHFETVGDHVVTLTAGVGGAEESCQTVVHVVDRRAPSLVGVPADTGASCASVPQPPEVQGIDACDGSVHVDFDQQRQDGPCEDAYTLVRRWSARDAAGHPVEALQRIAVSDAQAPVLSGVPGDIAVACNAVPAPASVSASDDCDPLPALRFTEARVNGRCAGDYTLLRDWTATDRCGNARSARQVVVVFDTTPPVVTEGSGGSHCIWPPNHWHSCFDQDDFQPIVRDACSDPVTWRFVGCASDQPADAEGDGSTEDDCVVAPDGLSFCVRAERQGTEGDRHYVVSIVARDGCGNESASVDVGTVRVPHDQSAHDDCLRTTRVGLRPNQPLPWGTRASRAAGSVRRGAR